MRGASASRNACCSSVGPKFTTTSSSRVLMPLSGLWGYLHTHGMHARTHAHICKHAHTLFLSKRRQQPSPHRQCIMIWIFSVVPETGISSGPLHMTPEEGSSHSSSTKAEGVQLSEQNIHLTWESSPGISPSPGSQSSTRVWEAPGSAL